MKNDDPTLMNEMSRLAGIMNSINESSVSEDAAENSAGFKSVFDGVEKALKTLENEMARRSDYTAPGETIWNLWNIVSRTFMVIRSADKQNFDDATKELAKKFFAEVDPLMGKANSLSRGMRKE